MLLTSFATMAVALLTMPTPSASFALPFLRAREAAPGSSSSSSQECCLAPSDAQSLVNDYAQLINSYSTPLAQQVLAADYSEESDSIDSLEGEPVGTETFPTKASFMAAQLQNGDVPFTVESVDAVACTDVALRWKASPGTEAETVRGITIFKATKATGSWQIETLYVEFNTWPWLVDIGGSCTE